MKDAVAAASRGWEARLKGTKGSGAASFITQAKGQSFITVAKRSSGNMCGNIWGHLLIDITQTLVGIESCRTFSCT